MRTIRITLISSLLLIGVYDKSVRGDGGTVRLSRCEGRYRISVFTGPTPFRAGPVDISALVQDAVTGVLISEASVTFTLTPLHHLDRPICQSATSEAATNKLLKAALFELPEPGRWTVEVAIKGEEGSAQVQFLLEAASRAPQWPAIWPWIGWPVPVILLFSIHQVLVLRKQRRPA